MYRRACGYDMYIQVYGHSYRHVCRHVYRHAYRHVYQSQHRQRRNSKHGERPQRTACRRALVGLADGLADGRRRRWQQRHAVRFRTAAAYVALECDAEDLRRPGREGARDRRITILETAISASPTPQSLARMRARAGTSFDRRDESFSMQRDTCPADVSILTYGCAHVQQMSMLMSVSMSKPIFMHTASIVMRIFVGPGKKCTAASQK